MIDRALTELIESGQPDGWSERCWQQVDGMGAKRVAAIMALDAFTPLVARPARLEDEKKILCWANDPQVRFNSFNPDPIEPATHRAWFQKCLFGQEYCRLFIVESLEGYSVGQVRFERANEEWEIHYGIDACYRRRGIAANFLATALQTFGEEFPDVIVYGRVKPENKASCGVFRKLGFVETQGESETAFHLRIG
jgi:RimJ/RimL family protein N-acetyltransferase